MVALRAVTELSSPGTLLDFLAKIPGLNLLDREALRPLAEAARRVPIEAGAVLARKGDRGADLFLLEQGRVRLDAAEEGSPSEVAREGALLAVGVVVFGVHAVTLVAETDCSIQELPRKDFNELLQRFPELMAHLVNAERSRLRRGLMLSVLPPMLGPLDPATLEEIEQRASWVELRSGQVLFHKNDVPDAWYIIASGRLRVSDHETLLGELGRGQSIGESGLLTSLPRSATVSAIRDTELIRISAALFDELAARFPAMLRNLSRVVVSRSIRVSGGDRRPGPRVIPCVNITLIPAHPGVPLDAFTRRLVASLERIGPTIHLTSSLVEGTVGILGIDGLTDGHPAWLRFSTWLDEQAADHRFVVLEADASLTPWTRRVLREADQVLLVADASQRPEMHPFERECLGHTTRSLRTERTLVLLHPPSVSLPQGTSRWLAARDVDRHCHVGARRDGDVDRLARELGRCSIGLALGAGGARGFAHLGVLRAIGELGIPVDHLGGVSSGAMVGGLYAMGRRPDEILALSREIAAQRPFGDFALPVTSIVNGKRVERAVERLFGGVAIEDLWIPFFCTSCDISEFRNVVHDSGSLASAALASGSVPAVLPPQVRDGHLHVDGGTTNMLPADLLRQRCHGRIIAVDISRERTLLYPAARYPTSWAALWTRLRPGGPPTPNFVELFFRAVCLGVARQTAAVARDADVFLRPPVEHVGTSDFHAHATLERLGYEHAHPRLYEALRAGVLSSQGRAVEDDEGPHV